MKRMTPLRVQLICMNVVAAVAATLTGCVPNRSTPALPAPPTPPTPPTPQIIIIVTATPDPSVPSASAAKTPSQGMLPQTPANIDPTQLEQMIENVYVDLYERTSPSVVHITSRTQVYDFFRGAVPQEGTGSGFIYDRDGHIVTNNHVVEGADELEVVFADGTQKRVTVVGADAYNDLAVLKVDGLGAAQLKPLVLGTAQTLKVGMRVIAIGNPFGLDRTLTTGVISALGRTVERSDQDAIGEVIQTDAAINPGNSGGPLLNLRGEVVGVNTSIKSPTGGSVGIGFAVPAATVKRVVSALVASGRYDHPWLGFNAYEINTELAQALQLPVEKGLLIAQLQPGGAAERAGVRGAQAQEALRGGGTLLTGGDILTAIDGHPVNTRDQMTIYLENNKRVGDSVTLALIRDGKPLNVTATLTARS